jgi:3D (Asp-Asp-Asp) domain-containing protein
MTNRRRVYMVRRAVTSAVLLGVLGGGSVLVVAWADRSPRTVETAEVTVTTALDELVNGTATSVVPANELASDGAISATPTSPVPTVLAAPTSGLALVTAPPTTAPPHRSRVAGTVVEAAPASNAATTNLATTKTATTKTTPKKTATTKAASTAKTASTKAATTKPVTTSSPTATTEVTVSASGVSFPALGAIPADVASIGTFKIVCYSLGPRTASGEPVGVNVVAVDPAVIALKTRLYIDGVGWRTALDTGTAVKGKILDIWMPTTADCAKWGAKNREVFKASSGTAGTSAGTGTSGNSETTAPATTSASTGPTTTPTTALTTTSPSTVAGGDSGP